MSSTDCDKGCDKGCGTNKVLDRVLLFTVAGAFSTLCIVFGADKIFTVVMFIVVMPIVILLLALCFAIFFIPWR
jgi:hypothetical protein